MASLADRVRAARETWVTAGGREWLIRRPTDVQLARLSGGRLDSGFAVGCVVGWKLPGVDLHPGGDPAVPPFDGEAFREWVEDRPETVVELTHKLSEIIGAYYAKQEEAKKK